MARRLAAGTCEQHSRRRRVRHGNQAERIRCSGGRVHRDFGGASVAFGYSSIEKIFAVIARLHFWPACWPDQASCV